MIRRLAIALVAGAVIALVLVLVLAGGGGRERPPVPVPRPAKPHAKPHAKARAKRRQAPGSPAHTPILGIGDDKADTLSDPRFVALGVRRVRLTTPWNSVLTEKARLDAWLSAARARGLEPLVAFNLARGDRCPARPCVAPSVARYRLAVRTFHARYPWVKLIQPWNEANSPTEPTARDPARAAQYYAVVRSVCPDCTVPAADVLDVPSMARWVRAFTAALGERPRLWGLHNYADTNRFRQSGTLRLLRLVPGHVWVTETGGIVSFTTQDGRKVFPYDERRAARATEFTFRLALAHAKRIARLYLYQWKIDFQGNRFDAGLVAADGRARPALAVVERHRSWIR